MGTAKDRREEELAYQSARAKRIADLRPTPAYQIDRFRRCKHWWIYPKEFAFRQMGDPSMKHVLDFGCGEGEVGTQLAKLGAFVTGVDISPELIEVAQKRAQLDGVEDRAQFLVCDIEDSSLPVEKFDFVICYAALHHIDLKSVLPRLVAVLKPGGAAIMIEPISLSKLLRRVRDVIPVAKEGGPLDRPLSLRDVDYIKGCFARTRICFFDIFARFQRFLPRTRGNRLSAAKIAALSLGGLDRVLLTLCPPLSRFSGSVVMVGEKASVAQASSQTGS